MEVKERIISKISKIEDQKFLDELESIITSLQSADDTTFELSNEMVTSVNMAEDDIKSGRVASNDQVMQSMWEWIKEK